MRRLLVLKWKIFMDGAYCWCCFLLFLWKRQENQKRDKIVFFVGGGLQCCGVTANWTHFKGPHMPRYGFTGCIYTSSVCPQGGEPGFSLVHNCLDTRLHHISVPVRWLEDLTIPDFFFFCLCLNSALHLLLVMILVIYYILNCYSLFFLGELGFLFFLNSEVKLYQYIGKVARIGAPFKTPEPVNTHNDGV